jgi:NADH-quinone oxidoreductase subunit D
MANPQTIEFRDPGVRAAAAAASSDELQDLHGDKLVLNMGPSHPSTHGVLRVLIEMDGETITKAMPDLGYLHRGDEKIAENMTYNQFIPYTDRLDYLAPLANNVAYALAVEKLLGIHDSLPPRCQYIRVICCELARISAHLLGLGASHGSAVHHELYPHRWRDAGPPSGMGREGPQVL